MKTKENGKDPPSAPDPKNRVDQILKADSKTTKPDKKKPEPPKSLVLSRTDTRIMALQKQYEQISNAEAVTLKNLEDLRQQKHQIEGRIGELQLMAAAPVDGPVVKS